MKSSCRLILLTGALFCFGQPTMADGAATGRSALEAARAAYRAAGTFRETLNFVLELPDGRREMRRQEYGVGKRGEVFLSLSADGKETLRLVARDGRMVGTQFNVPELYAEVPYEGDFAAAMRQIGSEQAQLTAPPAVVARQGGDLEALLTALRLGVLAPLEVAGFRPAAARGGSALTEVDLHAANGQATIGLDAASHRLRTIRVALGEGSQQVRASGQYTFAAGDSGDAPFVLPDLTGRAAVRTLADIQAGNHPLGAPAPNATLMTLDGATIHLADLRGSVVVLDFWATWCVPCWTALEHTAELASWAKTSELPVKVYAVNTLERVASPAEQSRKAADFLRSRKLEVPVLLDPGDAAFAAFQSPGLPSLVILDAEGRLARYHSGLLPDMVTTVRGEVAALLKPGKPGAP